MKSAYRNDEGEWIYPQMYYRDHKPIAKKRLLEEAERNQLLQEAMRIEPRIRQLFERVKKERCLMGYNANDTFYEVYKPQIVRLVGFDSPHKALRTMKHYDAVYDTIYDLLPADEVDLYQDGIMPNEMFAPSLQEKYGREYP